MWPSNNSGWNADDCKIWRIVQQELAEQSWHYVVDSLHYWWGIMKARKNHASNAFNGESANHKQVALLWQRDRAMRLSVEILQLQNIPIVWYYLRDPTFSRFYTIPECGRHTHTHTHTETDGQIHDDGMYCVSIASRGKNRPYCTAHKV